MSEDIESCECECEWWIDFPLQEIPKDVWNHMAKEGFINEKDVFTLAFVCKELWTTLSKLDNVIWRKWCIESFEIDDVYLRQTLSDITEEECGGSYKTFYLGWNNLEYTKPLPKTLFKEKCKKLLKFRYMMKRVIDSKKDRKCKNFLDFFMLIQCDGDINGGRNNKVYPSQLLLLDLEHSSLDDNGNYIRMVFTPGQNADNKYNFSGLEGNYSRNYLKVVSRNGTTKQKVYDNSELYYDTKDRVTLLSKKDREKLGKYFKDDANSYLSGGGGGRSVIGRVSHSYAKGADYTPEMQSRMLRQDCNISSLPEISCKKILESTLSVNVVSLYDKLIELHK